MLAKIVVAAVRDRGTGNVRTTVLTHLNKTTLQAATRPHLVPGRLLYTDENNAYAGLPHRQSVNHNRQQYVDGDIHGNGMESFWVLMKRGYHGTSYHRSRRHAQRYADEFAGRLNMRKLNLSTLEMLVLMWRKGVGRPRLREPP